MAFRQRTPTFRPQLSMRRVYETLQPRSEIKEVPEAYLLHVYIPGFPRDSVKITYVAPSGVVRITGERQIQGARWIRFDESYPVPEYCEPERLGGKFETGILTLTMPKKATSQAASKQQEVEETPQEKGVAAEAKPDEKVQDSIPPQSTTTTKVEEEPIEDKKKSDSPPSPDLKAQKKASLEATPSQIPSEPIKDQKGQEEAVERVGPTVTGEPQMGEKELEKPKPTPTMETKMKTDERPQKGQKEFEPKPAPTMLTKIKTAEKPQKDQEEIQPTPTMLTKVKTAEKPQKDQEKFEPKPTMLTKVKTAEKPQKGQEEFEPRPTPTMLSKVKTYEEPPKSQEEGEPQSTTRNVTRKLSVKEQLEEKKREGTSAEDSDKERISKKEVIEQPSESRKPVKDKEEGDFEEEETETEKFLDKEVETSAPKDQKKKEKESSSRTGPKREGKSEENAMECVGSVSQAVTKIAEGIWNEEEKKLAANIGAAVLVIAALGAYVSYRFSS